MSHFLSFLILNSLQNISYWVELYSLNIIEYCSIGFKLEELRWTTNYFLSFIKEFEFRFRFDEASERH